MEVETWNVHLSTGAIISRTALMYGCISMNIVIRRRSVCCVCPFSRFDIKVLNTGRWNGSGQSGQISIGIDIFKPLYMAKVS